MPRKSTRRTAEFEAGSRQPGGLQPVRKITVPAWFVAMRQLMHQFKEPRWKRMNLNGETNLHDAFKASTAAQGKKMTDVLIELIQEYIQNIRPKAQGADRRNK